MATHETILSGAQRPIEQVTPTASAARIVFLDHIRVYLTALVIIHHLAITYGVVALWYYIELPNDQLTQTIAGLVVSLNQAFFMGCFFFIAGTVAPAAYNRRGFAGFLRERGWRLGIPLLLFMFIINPLTGYLGYSYLPEAMKMGSSLSFFEFAIISFGPGPLWFLEALLLFSLVYACWRRFVQPQPPQIDAEQPVPGLGAIFFFVLGLAISTFLLRIWVPMGMYIPVIGFPSASHLPQYSALFVVGIMAARRNWLMRFSRRAGRWGFAATVVSTVLLFPFIFSETTGSFLGGMNRYAAAYATWEAIFCVGMCWGVLGLFRTYFNRSAPIGSFLARQSYAVYFIHAPVVVAVSVALRTLPLHPLAKCGLAILIALPLCVLVATLIRRLPGVRSIL